MSGEAPRRLRIKAPETALLLVDMQRCFVDESSPFAISGAAALVPTLNELSASCRARGALVIYTAHMLRPDHSNGGTLPDLIPDVAAGMIDQGSENAALRQDLAITDKDIVVMKPRFSAFAGTDLELILRTRNIQTVVVGGVETHICCESTARDAADRGFRVMFLSDGTASGPRPDGGWSENSQEACLSRIGMFFGEVATVDQVGGALDEMSRAQSPGPT